MNYEETPFYSIEVSINDGKFTTVMSIAVEIINQNEWPPTFLKSGKGPLNGFIHVLLLVSHMYKRLIYILVKFKAGVRPSCTHVNQTVKIFSADLSMPKIYESAVKGYKSNNYKVLRFVLYVYP